MTEEVRWQGKTRLLIGGFAVFILGLILVSMGNVLASPDADIPPNFPPTFGVSLLVVLVALFVVVRWFTRLTIEITGDTITVGFGGFRDRVALTDIVACDVVGYSWIAWGGWGIRRRFFSPRAKLYNVPGDGGRAVRLRLSSGKELWFSSRDPERICAALIERNPSLAGQSFPSR